MSGRVRIGMLIGDNLAHDHFRSQKRNPGQIRLSGVSIPYRELVEYFYGLSE
jgi:hypothetical protein